MSKHLAKPAKVVIHVCFWVLAAYLNKPTTPLQAPL